VLSINVKQLESLTGLMAACSKAFPSARALIRRFYDVLASVKVQKSYYKVRVTNEIRYDAVMIISTVLITKPNYFITVVGPTVLFSAKGTPIFSVNSVNAVINRSQSEDKLLPGKIKSSK
jgi:hypothetical protein